MKTKVDLVEKLRTWKGRALTHVVLNEAADEIERLRKGAALWKNAAEMYELGDITFAERLVDEARRAR